MDVSPVRLCFFRRDLPLTFRPHGGKVYVINTDVQEAQEQEIFNSSHIVTEIECAIQPHVDTTIPTVEQDETLPLQPTEDSVDDTEGKVASSLDQNSVDNRDLDISAECMQPCEIPASPRDPLLDSIDDTDPDDGYVHSNQLLSPTSEVIL